VATWRVFGIPILTDDATSLNIFQKIKAINSDIIIRSMRSTIILNNNPSFTAITLKCYSDNGGAPKALIQSATNSFTKAAVLTLNNGLKELYFNFNDLILKKNTVYHFVFLISGYTGNESSHIAWAHSFPDPVYQTNVEMSFEAMLRSPLRLYVANGAEL